MGLPGALTAKELFHLFGHSLLNFCRPFFRHRSLSNESPMVRCGEDYLTTTAAADERMMMM